MIKQFSFNNIVGENMRKTEHFSFILFSLLLMIKKHTDENNAQTMFYNVEVIFK